MNFYECHISEDGRHDSFTLVQSVRDKAVTLTDSIKNSKIIALEFSCNIKREQTRKETTATAVPLPIFCSAVAIFEEKLRLNARKSCLNSANKKIHSFV